MPSVPVVMISGHGTIETAVEAIKIGAYDFIEKPFKSDRLLLVVERAIEAAQLRRENDELRLRAGGELDLVGASPAINQLRQQIERVAPTGSRVLMTGAPGSGKEVVGRLLHARSRRADGPFVAVNCATMRPDRLEIELFGAEGQQRRHTAQDRHLRARAWRHAVSRRSRRHAARNPGQDRARAAGADLRAGRGVAPGRGRCPGASPPRTANLSSEIAAGRFREDLFYRLNVVPIRVPPLRERREDIPLLARHFMAARRGSGAHRRRAISARTRWRRCRPTPGPAMCGNCATSSTGC